MQKLVAGVHRFRADSFKKHEQLFHKLSTQGQKPETLFITCSDSRVDPNLITSSNPGELFIVRNIGNMVPSVEAKLPGGVSAAIEFAVEVLEVSTILVCGHTQCGAMDAILNPERVKHLPYVSKWLKGSSRIPAILEERYGELEPEQRVNAAVQENVLTQLENLRTFDFVAKRLEAGKIALAGWVFKIATGDVFEYDPASEQFLAVTKNEESPLTRRAKTDPPPPVT